LALRTVFDAHMARADLRKARLVAAEALRRFREEGRKQEQIQASVMLVEMYLKAAKLDECLTAAKRGCSVCKETGDHANHGAILAMVARAKLRMSPDNVRVAMNTARDAWNFLLKVAAPSDKCCDDKVAAMQVIADCHSLEKSLEDGKVEADEFVEHFRAISDARGEGYAVLIAASMLFKLQRFDEALKLGQRAQSLFNEENDMKGEADALKLNGEMQWKKNEFKAAVRLGERARALYREVEKPQGEVACMYMIAETSVRNSVKEGAKIYSDEPMPRPARDALDKGIKVAEAGIKMARHSDMSAAPELIGSLLCARAQGLTLKARFDEALACADEAVLHFRELGAYQLEANALMLACDNLRALQKMREAAEAADEALALYRHMEDSTGAKLASDVLDSFQQYLQQQQQQQHSTPQPTAGAQMQQQFMQEVQARDGPAAKVSKPERAKGPALDLKAGLSLDVVKSKVQEVAMRITGADDGDIEADTPLMEAGLTSNSAILLRDELSQALPGVSLPVTLVFDYPSVAAMSELILESSGAKAIGN